MRLIKSTILVTDVLISSHALANAETKVIASIKPVHSLVSALMEGVGSPGLLVEGAGSPHSYSLKPSQAEELQAADVIFWMGHDLEAFLENSIKNIAKNAKSVSLMDAHDLIKLNFREGGAFEAHAHDDHDDHDDHGHDETDPHVWLDPANAKALVHEIEEVLTEVDPANASVYDSNAQAMMSKLDNLMAEIDTELQPVKGRGYVVFHDAYQYFENRFGVSAIGSITVSPEVMPGAERITELREKVKSLDATCVFSEPQFEPKLVKTVTENTNAGTGVLDPLGASINDGPDLYFTLIRNMAKSLKDCLSR